MLKKLSSIVNRLTIWIADTLIIIMTCSVLTQITARNLFSTSFEALEELSRFLLVWVTFLGTVITYKDNGHIGVKFFVNMFPENIKNLILKFSKMFDICFGIVLIYFGFLMSRLTMRQISLQMGIRIGLVYMVIPVSGLLLLVHIIEKLFNDDVEKNVIEDELIEKM